MVDASGDAAPESGDKSASVVTPRILVFFDYA